MSQIGDYATNALTRRSNGSWQRVPINVGVLFVVLLPRLPAIQFICVKNKLQTGDNARKGVVGGRRTDLETVYGAGPLPATLKTREKHMEPMGIVVIAKGTLKIMLHAVWEISDTEENSVEGYYLTLDGKVEGEVYEGTDEGYWAARQQMDTIASL